MPTEMSLRRPSSVISPGVAATFSRSAAVTSTSSRSTSSWLGRSPSTRSKISIATGTRSGCATHVPSYPCPASRSLSSRTFASATAFTSASRRDGMNAAMPPIACAPRLWHVFTSSSAYERMNGVAHPDRVAVGQHELGTMAELLDHAEQVVPAARVEPRRVRPELVEDLVHLERREDRLDQHRRAHRAARNPERVLRQLEHAVPQPRLAMRLELRQIEVRPAADPLQRARGCGTDRARSRRATPTSARRRPRSGARACASRAAARAASRPCRSARRPCRSARGGSSGRSRRRGCAARRSCSPTSASSRPRNRS